MQHRSLQPSQISTKESLQFTIAMTTYYISWFKSCQDKYCKGENTTFDWQNHTFKYAFFRGCWARRGLNHPQSIVVLSPLSFFCNSLCWFISFSMPQHCNPTTFPPFRSTKYNPPVTTMLCTRQSEYNIFTITLHIYIYIYINNYTIALSARVW